MAVQVLTLPYSTVLPTGSQQFGDKLFITCADSRPVVVHGVGSYSGVPPKAYYCGIKPPTTAPSLANASGSHTNLVAGQTVYVSYAYYSSTRNVFSRMSPTAQITVGTKKITVSGFQASRDDATTNDIDKIVICVQQELNSGLMALMPDTVISYSTSGTFDFDISASDMEQGMNFTEADAYFDIPPATKFVAKHGERIWFGGQREDAIPTTGTVFKCEKYGDGTNTVKYRGVGVARLTITAGSWRFDDSLLHTTCMIIGISLGSVVDVYSDTVLYLSQNIGGTVTGQTDVVFKGRNDGLWPSSYHVYNAGNVPTVYPECVNLNNYTVLAAALDSGQSIHGMAGLRDSLTVLMGQGGVSISGGLEVNIPEPFIRTDFGRSGTIAERSVCIDSGQTMAWWDIGGPKFANTASVVDVTDQLPVKAFCRSGQWVAAADVPSIVMNYSREMRGYIFANLTIDGEDDCWGYFSESPQGGLWLFDGMNVTSNIIEYLDVNGTPTIMCGDERGNVKQLLKRNVWTDLGVPYACKWRSGWIGAGGNYLALNTFDASGSIIPGDTFSFTIRQYTSDYPTRDVDYGTASYVTCTKADLLYTIGMPPYHGRYVAVEIEADSDSGVSDDKIFPWQMSAWRVR